MSSAPHDAAAGNLGAHGESIDELHRKLAAAPGVDKPRLQIAVDKYKKAYAQFCEDAQGCMN
jgi:hypothetical protein